MLHTLRVRERDDLYTGRLFYDLFRTYFNNNKKTSKTSLKRILVHTVHYLSFE